MAFHGSTYGSLNKNNNLITGTTELIHEWNGIKLKGISLVSGYNGSSAGLDCHQRLLHEVLDSRQRTLSAMLQVGFKNMQDRMKLLTSNNWENSAYDIPISGCSATVIVTNGKEIGIGGVGDNVVFKFSPDMGRLSGKIMSTFHHIDNTNERRRLEQRWKQISPFTTTHLVVLNPPVGKKRMIGMELKPKYEQTTIVTVTCLTRGLGNLWGDFGPYGEICDSTPEILTMHLDGITDCFLVVVTKNISDVVGEREIGNYLLNTSGETAVIKVLSAALGKANGADLGPMSMVLLDVNKFVKPNNTGDCNLVADPDRFIYKTSDDITDNVYDMWNYPNPISNSKRYFSHDEWESFLNQRFLDANLKNSRDNHERCAISTDRRVENFRKINATEPKKNEITPTNVNTLAKPKMLLKVLALPPLGNTDIMKFLKLMSPEEWKSCGEDKQEKCVQSVTIPESWQEFGTCEIFLNFQKRKRNIEPEQEITKREALSPCNNAENLIPKREDILGQINDSPDVEDNDNMDTDVEDCDNRVNETPNVVPLSTDDNTIEMTSMGNGTKDDLPVSKQGTVEKDNAHGTQKETDVAVKNLLNILEGKEPHVVNRRTDVIDIPRPSPPRLKTTDVTLCSGGSVFKPLVKRHDKPSVKIPMLYTKTQGRICNKQKLKRITIKGFADTSPVRNQRVFRIKVKNPPGKKLETPMVHMQPKIKDSIGCDLNFLTPDFLAEALKLEPMATFQNDLGGYLFNTGVVQDKENKPQYLNTNSVDNMINRPRTLDEIEKQLQLEHDDKNPLENVNV